MTRINLFLINHAPLNEYPALGLIYLAGYIRNKINIEIRILDKLSEKKVLRLINKHKPELIGFTSVSSNYYQTNKLAGEIKKICSSYLIIGGVHITVSPQSFGNSNFDIGVIGEGELTLEELIVCYQTSSFSDDNLKKIKGIVFRNGNQIIQTEKRELIEDLSILPIPAWDLLNMRFYSLPRIFYGMRRETSIMTSRGCPYNCRYCNSTRWERKIRYIPEDKVVDEIELLHKKYKINHIFLNDDIFCFDKNRVRNIIKLLDKRGLLGKVSFKVSARANIFDDETAQLFLKLNVIQIHFGFESGSEKVLKYLKRGSVTVKDNIRACNICKKYRLNYAGLMMVGNPYETEKDLEDTYNFIKNNLAEVTIGQLVALPSTEVYDYAIKNKVIKEDYYDYENEGKSTEVDFDDLISQDISKERFKYWFYKIKSLENRKLYFDKSQIPLIILWCFNPYFFYYKIVNLIQKLNLRKNLNLL